jgi:hypothetical protein
MRMVVLDDLFPNQLVDEANRQWPADDWPGWVNYGEPNHRKRASDLREPLPVACSVLLARIAALPVSQWFPDLPAQLLPDLSLHGAGLHELRQGGVVGDHLDADSHGRLGLQRVLSAALYLNWQRGGGDVGGELRGDGVVVEPRMGRLVVFDCRRLVHSVAEWRQPWPRRSLAVFWYTVEPGGGQRRAQFT